MSADSRDLFNDEVEEFQKKAKVNSPPNLNAASRSLQLNPYPVLFVVRRGNQQNVHQRGFIRAWASYIFAKKRIWNPKNICKYYWPLGAEAAAYGMYR